MPHLPGIGGFVGQMAVGKPILTYRGHGSVVLGAANLVQNYGTLIGGAAPQAGDLVVWNTWVADTAADPNAYADLSGLGWTQFYTALAGGAAVFRVGLYAKQVTAADLSSPPLMYTAALNSGGIWLAYSVSGAPIKSLTWTNWQGAYQVNNLAPPAVVQNMAADTPPSLLVSHRQVYFSTANCTQVFTPGPIQYEGKVAFGQYVGRGCFMLSQANPVSQTVTGVAEGSGNANTYSSCRLLIA